MSINRVMFVILVACLVVLAVGGGPGVSNPAQALPPGKESVTHGVTIPYPGRLSDESG